MTTYWTFTMSNLYFEINLARHWFQTIVPWHSLALQLHIFSECSVSRLMTFSGWLLSILSVIAAGLFFFFVELPFSLITSPLTSAILVFKLRLLVLKSVRVLMLLVLNSVRVLMLFLRPVMGGTCSVCSAGVAAHDEGVSGRGCGWGRGVAPRITPCLWLQDLESWVVKSRSDPRLLHLKLRVFVTASLTWRIGEYRY